MISEALERYVEDGRVSHCWCMCVVSHGYGGLGGSMYGGGGWYVRGKKPGGWSYDGRCWSTYRVRGDTLVTSDHTAFHVHISLYGRDGIGRSSWEGLSTGRHEKAQVR